MNIEHRPEGELGSFVAVEEETEAGELAYRIMDGSILTLDHTEVGPAFEGKGVGKLLVTTAVEYAKANNMKVRPLCTYAELLFKRNKEWGELSG